MNDYQLNNNSTKVVAFEEVVTKVVNKNGYESNLYGTPQRIKLPFKCDTKINIEPEP